MSLKDRLYRTLLISKLGISGEDADHALRAAAELLNEPAPPHALHGLEVVLESFHWLTCLLRARILPLRLPDRASGRPGIIIDLDRRLERSEHAHAILAHGGEWRIIGRK